MAQSKLRIGIVFGGRSGEHEISLISARAIVDALDRDKYEPVLIGIDRRGHWHLDAAGRALLSGPGKPLALDGNAPEIAVAPGVGRQLVPVPENPTREGPTQTQPENQPQSHPQRHSASPESGDPQTIDVFFPVLHGTYGEDGTIQGLFEMAGVPYVGAGVLGSAVGMDKDVAKRLLRDADIGVVDYLTVRASSGQSPDALAAKVAARFGFPCFVKPANLGSSVGVCKVQSAADLGPAVDHALRYDRKVLIERAVDAREIECAVLGNDNPRASVPGEIVPNHDFYSYEAKYEDAKGADLLIPAPLSAEQARAVQELSIRTFRALDLVGMARVDFLLERTSERLFVNEVNTIPGFTQISMYPKLWQASGISYPELVDQLIALALERHGHRQGLSIQRLPDR